MRCSSIIMLLRNLVNNTSNVTSFFQVSILSDVLPKLVILDCANMSEVDYTVSQGLLQVICDLHDNEIDVYFSHVQHHVKATLLDAGVEAAVFNDEYLDGHPNLFSSSAAETISIESPCCNEQRFWMTSV